MENENDVEMGDANEDTESSMSESKTAQFIPWMDTQFENLPIQLYNEIFKFLTISQRNKIREVAVSWDYAIRYAFGLKIILNNHNIHDMAAVNDIMEIQVRNLTRKLPESLNIKIFEYASKVRHLEIMGMILSTNLLKLLTEFKSVTTLKLTRVYLETDRQLRLSDELKRNFPANLTHLKMSFLKTFHHKNYLRFARGRHTSSDLYTLTSSDNIILNLVQNFNFGHLKTLELYHNLTEDIKIKRHSEMINRIRSQIAIQNQNPAQDDPGAGAGDGGDNNIFPEQNQNELQNLEFQQDFESEGTRAISNIFTKLASFGIIQNLKLDTLPSINLPENDRELAGDNNSLYNLQFESLELTGILGMGWTAVLNTQNKLKSLKVSLLDRNLMEIVKNTVRRCQNTLETLAIILGTPDALIIENQNLNQGQQPNNNIDFDIESDLDLSFLKDCQHLQELTIYFAPRKIDLNFLPGALVSLEICGKIDINEVKIALERTPNLNFLKIDICNGPQYNDFESPDQPIVERQGQIFSQIQNLKYIIDNSSVKTLVISEAGAFDNFKRFVILSEEMAGVRKVCLDFVEFRTPLLPLMLPPVVQRVHAIGPEDVGRSTFVSVPRITISVSRQL